MAKDVSMGAAVPGEYLEVSYFQRELTPTTFQAVQSEVNAKLEAGWKIIYTSHFVSGTVGATIFHVLAR